MNKILKEQATKAITLCKAFGLDVSIETPDDYFHSIDFSNGVTLYITQGNPGAPVFYTVGYWDENVSFVPEFSDNQKLFMAIEQVLVLPTMWNNHKKLKELSTRLNIQEGPC